MPKRDTRASDFGPEELDGWASILAGTSPDPDVAWSALTEELARRALASWPDLEVDLGAFFQHVASCLPADARELAVAQLCVEDLYLAYACAQNDERALAGFEREVWGELKAALSKLRVPAGDHDDVRQELWEKLFVGTSSPKILDYAGRGRLRSWFRVTATRALLDRRRGQAGTTTEEPGEDLASAEADPELEYLKRVYDHEFKLSFEQAILALSPEDRNTLRSYYSQQMSIDEIATAFGIHRATAARRVNRARDALLSDTRRRMSEKLRLNSKELKSVLGLVESRLHASVRRLLG
jgi:RNA polymerase sigma-70 factor, ECF subfamily